MPKGCLGASGAASGLLNLAIRSLREPETARERSPPGASPAGELDREFSCEPGLDLNRQMLNVCCRGGWAYILGR